MYWEEGIATLGHRYYPQFKDKEQPFTQNLSSISQPVSVQDQVLLTLVFLQAELVTLSLLSPHFLVVSSSIEYLNLRLFIYITVRPPPPSNSSLRERLGLPQLYIPGTQKSTHGNTQIVSEWKRKGISVSYVHFILPRCFFQIIFKKLFPKVVVEISSS